MSVIDNALVYLITDNKQVVLAGQGHDAPQNVLGKNRAGGVIRVDDQDPGHRRIVLDPVFQVLKVREPVIVGVKSVSNRPIAGMGRLSGGMGGITGGGNHHPGSPAQQAVNLADRITQAVKKKNIIRTDLHPAQAIDLSGQKLAGGTDAAGGAVAIAGILHSAPGHQLFHPQGNFLTLGHRIADILPVGLDP